MSKSVQHFSLPEGSSSAQAEPRQASGALTVLVTCHLKVVKGEQMFAGPGTAQVNSAS